MENILEVKEISKIYKGFKLEDVSFNVPKGTIVGFIGENGAGKTTTIKIILDIIKKHEGKVKIFGTENGDFNREDIGIVLDECCFQENLNIKDINKIMKNLYKRWDEKKFFKLISEFNIPKEKVVKEFSKGTTMKTSIAVALSHNPKLLILDEATSGLDPVSRESILDILLEFIQDEEHGVLMSSHIVTDLEKVCDYITFIHKGKIIFNDEKDLLKEKYGIFNGTKKALEDIDEEAIIRVRKNEFGVKALVKREKVSKGIDLDKVNIEDIMLYHIK